MCHRPLMLTQLLMQRFLPKTVLLPVVRLTAVAPVPGATPYFELREGTTHGRHRVSLSAGRFYPKLSRNTPNIALAAADGLQYEQLSDLAQTAPRPQIAVEHKGFPGWAALAGLTLPGHDVRVIALDRREFRGCRHDCHRHSQASHVLFARMADSGISRGRGSENTSLAGRSCNEPPALTYSAASRTSSLW